MPTQQRNDDGMVHIPVEKYTSSKQWMARIFLSGVLGAFTAGGFFYTTVGRVGAHDVELVRLQLTKADKEVVQLQLESIQKDINVNTKSIDHLGVKQESARKEIVNLIKEGRR